jgi:hypothetical protein
MNRSGNVDPIELNEESKLSESKKLQFFELLSVPQINSSGVQELEKILRRFDFRLGKEDRHLVRVDVLEGVEDAGHRRAELLDQRLVSPDVPVGADEDEIGVRLRRRSRRRPKLTQQRFLPFFSAFSVTGDCTQIWK